MDGAMDDGEFQEADILWPDDTPRDELLPPPFAPSEPYEAAASVARCTPAFWLGRGFQGSSSFFLPVVQSSSAAGASPGTDVDEEEWQEADVLWPDTVDEARSCGGSSLWPFRGGWHVKPAAPRREGWAPGVSSSPIDIPANVAARRRVGVVMDRRRL